MVMRRLLHLLLPFALVLAACTGVSPTPAPDRLLILVSIDGFRWDYLQKYDAPVLQRLAAEGVHATRLNASYPSKTFPNHLTLVTGLRPEHHGIVSNTFYDPALGESFNKNRHADNTDPRWWQQGEPVWITAEKQGVRTGCVMWPGGEVEIHGARPSLSRPFEKAATSAERADQVIKWLEQPGPTRPRFCALYLEQVDNVGHKLGPDAPEIGAAIREVDEALGRLLAALDRLGLRDRTDLVIVSDHGLAGQGADRVIFLEDLMDMSQVQVESTGPNGGVRPKPGTISPAELAARIRAKAPPQLHVYLREETPARFHYRDNPRIPPVVLDCDEGWNIESKVGWPKFAAHYNRGNHGWDPALPSMGALFIAQGPSFRRGVELPVAENVDLYNLLCAVLGIQPAPNDGGDALVRAALRR
jgi:predicted AlkP superfamily pyrophosphatase or phosphodiesterase